MLKILTIVEPKGTLARYHSDFSGKETVTQRCSDLLKVTEQRWDKAMAGSSRPSASHCGARIPIHCSQMRRALIIHPILQYGARQGSQRQVPSLLILPVDFIMVSERKL